MANNILNVEISCAQVEDGQVIKDKTKEIVCVICALLNSRNGGKLNIYFDESLKVAVLALIRHMEQRFSDIIGCLAMAKKVQLTLFEPTKVIFLIESLSYLCTLNYNLYLPSETQVKCIDPNEPISVIERIVEGKQRTDHRPPTTLGSHRREFIKEESCGVWQANAQYVSLKTGSSIADQMTNKSSKFRMNCSALANAYGGHIYHGITDDGIVSGVEIDGAQRYEVIVKVEKAVKTMIWPVYGGPQRGRHWRVYFEPIKDSKGEFVSNTCVIVISVPPCPGGVFLSEPESYRVVKGKIEAMSFKEWKGELLFRLRRKESQYFDECMRSMTFPELDHSFLQIHTKPVFDLEVSDRSSNIELLCCKVIEKSMYLKNNGDRAGFNRFMRRLESEESSCQTEVSLLVLAQKISFAYATGCLRKAEKCLEYYQMRLSCSKNLDWLFHLAESYLESALERSKGNFETSFKLAKAALDETQSASISGFLAAWFNAKVAVALTMLVTKQEKTEDQEEMKRIAQVYHNKALANASVVHDDVPTALSDLHQKVFTSNAFLHLGCSISGDMVDKASITDLEIEKGKNCLLVVSKCILDGNSQSRLREVQYYLGLCALSLRRSHVNDEDQQQLKIAVGYAAKALKLATENNFEEMCHYSRNYLAALTENLIRINIATWQLCMK